MNKLDLYCLDKSSVTSRLVRWGTWKMRSGVANGYPKQSAFVRLGGISESATDWRGYEIDSECMATNKAVEMSPLFHQDVLRVEYIYAFRDTVVKANACGVGKRQYYNFLSSAHEIVANNLNIILRNVHENDTNMLSRLEVCAT